MVWKEPFARPPVQKEWSLTMQLLLKRSSSHDIAERPTMQNVESLLKREVVDCRNGNETGLEHIRRKSTFVYRRGSSSAMGLTRTSNGTNEGGGVETLGDSNNTSITL